MSRIILVHGAWQGAWCWDRLGPLLIDAGLRPMTVELTGSGTRASELDETIDLATHVEDVTAALAARDVTAEPGEPGCVLVVHSYSGMLAPAVVAAAGRSIAAVVFVDAFYPVESESALDQMPPPFQERFRQQALEVGAGWRLPAGEHLLDVWGLHDPDDRRWVGGQLSDWSLRCFESPSTAGQGALRATYRWYVVAAGAHPSAAAFAPLGRRAQEDGCTLVELACGHDVQVERPAELAAVIAQAAATARAGGPGLP